MATNKELNRKIGERIKAARETAGLTQERFSERIGVSVQYISDLERGKVGTSVPTLCKICDVLGVSSDYLLFGYRQNSSVADITERLYRLDDRQLGIVRRILFELIEAFKSAP